MPRKITYVRSKIPGHLLFTSVKSTRYTTKNWLHWLFGKIDSNSMSKGDQSKINTKTKELNINAKMDEKNECKNTSGKKSFLSVI